MQGTPAPFSGCRSVWGHVQELVEGDSQIFSHSYSTSAKAGLREMLKASTKPLFLHLPTQYAIILLIEVAGAGVGARRLLASTGAKK